MSDGAISNVRTTRITKIWTYIIQITSHDSTTVSRTVVFAILTFVIVVNDGCRIFIVNHLKSSVINKKYF